jgi:phosphoglycolate phosphatase-like HAD superfamily hydrolase
LFDIDGTLVSMGGAAREAFGLAIEQASGRPISLDGTSFAGRTDPQIARELLVRHGVDGADLEPAIRETIRLYLRHFADLLPRARGASTLPGVRALLEALSARPGVHLALLTGNVEAGARLKLDHCGIAGFFDFGLSCFGSDDDDRYRLPGLALRRARAALGAAISGSQLAIIGDSEHDVLCGRSIGARAIAVATGWTAAAKLLSLRPDRLLADFSDTAASVAAILGGAA